MQAVETLVPRTASRVRRIDMRVVIGVAIMLFATVGMISLVNNARARIPVLVAAQAIEPGEVIDHTDIRIADISVTAGIAFIESSRQSEIVGQIAAEPFWPGKVLGPQSIANTSLLPAGYVSMSLALKPQRAAAGDLRMGDRVAVISSPSADRNEPTTILFTDVVVQSVRRSQTAEGSALIVALRLRLEEARALAEAQSKGVIDLVLLSRAGGGE
jgi:Flp pilus assembly protein CpaB